jgi:hypothetical protein
MSEQNAEHLEVVAPSALEAMERANVDMLVSTAKKYPRDINVSKRNALAIVTLDPETAAECFFKYDRGGKTIQGPSIRLAEIVASTWGNIRAGSRTIQETETTVVAQGFCHDTQNNVFIAKEVERKICNKDGRKFNEDVIILTKNANCSIALRNAVFSVVPRAVINTIYEEAIKAAVGDIKTLAERVTKALSKFAAMGIVQEKVLAKLGLQRVDEITVEHLETLYGLYTAINEKETTVDEAFPAIKKGAAGQQQPVDAPIGAEPPAAATAATAQSQSPIPAPIAEIRRRAETDGVTVPQIITYLKSVKLMDKKSTELEQITDANAQTLIGAWSGVVGKLRSIKVEV